MPPITIVFFVSGIAVWANAMYFLGVGADRREGGADPLKSIGWVTLTAGLVDFVQAFAIMSNQLAGEVSIVLAGLVSIYALFFTFLGITEVLGLDLRPLGNVCIAVALVPLFYLTSSTRSTRGCSSRSSDLGRRLPCHHRGGVRKVRPKILAYCCS
jgi:uncharacterized membrane protein